MPIPPYTISGLLPGFVGEDAGLGRELMSPYKAKVAEVVQRFGTTVARRTILAGWLRHRIALRAAGIRRGFQWLDGSFVEDKETLRNEDPGDIDVITFFHRPHGSTTASDIFDFVIDKQHLFERNSVKLIYHVDLMLVDLQSSPETLVGSTRYYLLLFSHQRESYIWKGLVEVRLEDEADDQSMLEALTATISGT